MVRSVFSYWIKSLLMHSHNHAVYSLVDISYILLFVNLATPSLRPFTSPGSPLTLSMPTNDFRFEKASLVVRFIVLLIAQNYCSVWHFWRSVHFISILFLILVLARTPQQSSQVPILLNRWEYAQEGVVAVIFLPPLMIQTQNFLGVGSFFVSKVLFSLVSP